MNKSNLKKNFLCSQFALLRITLVDACLPVTLSIWLPTTLHLEPLVNTHLWNSVNIHLGLTQHFESCPSPSCSWISPHLKANKQETSEHHNSLKGTKVVGYMHFFKDSKSNFFWYSTFHVNIQNALHETLKAEQKMQIQNK